MLLAQLAASFGLEVVGQYMVVALLRSGRSYYSHIPTSEVSLSLNKKRTKVYGQNPKALSSFHPHAIKDQTSFL